MATLRLDRVERRVFALLFAAGEARIENSAILIAGGGELPATVIRRLIRKGLVSRYVPLKGKGPVIIRPSIGAARKVREGTVDPAALDRPAAAALP